MYANIKITPQYVKREADESPGVFINVTEFQHILDDLEELENIKAAYAFERRENKEFIPFRKALNEIGTVK